jgi:FK506-binding nuclear protein
MSAIQPVAVYALRVPAGGLLIPAVPDAAAMVRILSNGIDSWDAKCSNFADDSSA